MNSSFDIKIHSSHFDIQNISYFHVKVIINI